MSKFRWNYLSHTIISSAFSEWYSYASNWRAVEGKMRFIDNQALSGE